MTAILSVRVEDEVADDFDAIAAERGMRRSELLANLIDRTLAGAGRMSVEAVAERRERRAERLALFNAAEAIRFPEDVRDPARYPTIEDMAP